MLRIALGVFLFTALCAVLWMMFHGRQFLPDAVREEFRESQDKRRRRFSEIYGTREARFLLVLLVVMFVGLTMTRDRFWEASSWMERLGMVVFRTPVFMVIVAWTWWSRVREAGKAVSPPGVSR